MKTIRLNDSVLINYEELIKLQLKGGNKYHIHVERKERFKELDIEDVELLYGYIVLKENRKEYQLVDKNNLLFIYDGVKNNKLITFFKATNSRIKRLEDARVK